MSQAPKPPNPFDPVEETHEQWLKKVAEKIAKAAGDIAQWRRTHPKEAAAEDAKEAQRQAMHAQALRDEQNASIAAAENDPIRYKG